MQTSVNTQPLQFGQLKRIDIRQAWMDEEKDFTPWLAKNLHFLSDAIGLELILESEEVSVGSFRADILAKDAQTNSWVLIENQLERTNHSHLGQIVTYAAGLQASTVIWIAETFTDEHIAALDWLNSITDNSINFFALQIGLWSVGNIMVPQFNVLSRPNSWLKLGQDYKKAIDAGNFEKRQFVIDCLTKNPDMKGAEIQRKATELFGQTISAGYISDLRKLLVGRSTGK